MTAKNVKQFNIRGKNYSIFYIQYTAGSRSEKTQSQVRKRRELQTNGFVCPWQMTYSLTMYVGTQFVEVNLHCNNHENKC